MAESSVSFDGGEPGDASAFELGGMLKKHDNAERAETAESLS
jgi:hypothetical protein